MSPPIGAGHPRNDGHRPSSSCRSMTIGGRFTIPLDTPPAPHARRPSDFRCWALGDSWIVGRQLSRNEWWLCHRTSGHPDPYRSSSATTGLALTTQPSPSQHRLSLRSRSVSGGLPAARFPVASTSHTDPVDHRCVRRAGSDHDIPGGFRDRSAATEPGLNVSVDSSVPIIIVPPTPRLPGTRPPPSSGFFNFRRGRGVGFRQLRDGSSGWWNQAHAALAGAGSGVLNVGTLNSGVLNVGSGISGLYNTAIVGLGTPALVSGAGNVGQQLWGGGRDGVDPNPSSASGWPMSAATASGWATLGTSTWAR